MRSIRHATPYNLPFSIQYRRHYGYSSRSFHGRSSLQLDGLNHQEFQHVIEESTLNVAKETSPTLCLNADYTPLSTAPLSLLNWKDALRVVYSGRAHVVSVYESLVLRSVTLTFPLPSVIALKHYQQIPAQKPVLTRRNVFLRDKYKCQYCNTQFSNEKLTLDHVTPKCKGGLTNWTNVTTACIICNQRKGSSSLKELRPLGMRLLSNPRAPSQYDLQTTKKEVFGSVNKTRLHPHWKSFCIEFS